MNFKSLGISNLEFWIIREFEPVEKNTVRLVHIVCEFWETEFIILTTFSQMYALRQK